MAKFCPNCMNIIKKKDTECSNCGMQVSEMDFSKNPHMLPVLSENKEPELVDDIGEKKLTIKEKRKKKQKDVDFEKVFLMNEENNDDEIEELENQRVRQGGEISSNVDESVAQKPKRHKHKSKKKKNSPDFTVDNEGQFDINTKDVTFFEQEEEYSVKKARGDIEQEKLKWWEIYKWADRALARRKIMKEVNKAARVKPDHINKGVLIVLNLLLGWLGIHNFYAGNKKRGWAVVIMWAIIIPVISFEVLYKFMGVFVGGGLGFVVLSMWLFDFVSICFNRYKYDYTKMQFIRKLNTETRAKLGKKYIDIK